MPIVKSSSLWTIRALLRGAAHVRCYCSIGGETINGAVRPNVIYLIEYDISLRSGHTRPSPVARAAAFPRLILIIVADYFLHGTCFGELVGGWRENPGLGGRRLYRLSRLSAGCPRNGRFSRQHGQAH